MTKNNYEQDAQRLAENLDMNYGEQIQDKESFEQAYEDYLNEQPKALKNNTLKEKTYKKLLTSVSIRPSRREKLKRNAKKSLKKLKKQKIPSKRIIRQKGKRKKTYNYKYVGKIKNKTIYLRKIKTKRGVFYVDKLGRRGKIKKNIRPMRNTKNIKRKRHNTKA